MFSSLYRKIPADIQSIQKIEYQCKYIDFKLYFQVLHFQFMIKLSLKPVTHRKDPY